MAEEESKLKIDELKLKISELIIAAHKHYRGIAFGYTATLITLSTFQIGYLVRAISEGTLVLLFKVGVGFFVATIFLCLLVQSYLVKGYYFEARGDQDRANQRFFMPIDTMVNWVLLPLFWIGTLIVVIPILFCF